MHKQSNKYIHPLSDDNINNVVILCSKFIRERYNVSLEDSTLKEILTNIHKKNIQYFQYYKCLKIFIFLIINLIILILLKIKTVVDSNVFLNYLTVLRNFYNTNAKKNNSLNVIHFT